MSNASTSSTIEVLAQMWCRLLQSSSIGPADNFFDLGGDSALAVQLFAEIDDVFGQQLPPVMIYHVPTIASLAELISSVPLRNCRPSFRLRMARIILRCLLLLVWAVALQNSFNS